MSIAKARFKGKVRIHGRPKEQAAAEIRLMQAEDNMEQKKHRRLFFTILDILVLISFGFSIYSFYQGLILNGFLTLIPGICILTYFLIKQKFKKKTITTKTSTK
jgi:hypothetical protein